jgi:hypothetical protein
VHDLHAAGRGMLGKVAFLRSDANQSRFEVKHDLVCFDGRADKMFKAPEKKQDHQKHQRSQKQVEQHDPQKH